ncbi:hypothetical protein HYW46_06100 [Candidatus Daviesbacteria bacterium]|nr:hypothetical protein [Candidatus Daviesbacteria bacterium]
MVEKITVNNIASVGIIYRESDPKSIFIDIKDGGYPIKAFRWMHCPIGGNWIGKNALADANPLATFRRELHEELSFEKERISTGEMKQLGIDCEQQSYTVPKKDAIPTEKDHESLNYLKLIFTNDAQPFGDFRVTVPKSIFDKGVPDNKLGDTASLLPYYLVSVKENDWRTLEYLHEKFGNLSVESLAVITSLDEIISTPRYTCCGHDRIMKEFFTQMGCAGACQYPLLEGITCEPMGMPFDSYDKYLEYYEVLRHPFSSSLRA